jgi:hypothetical protein
MKDLSTLVAASVVSFLQLAGMCGTSRANTVYTIDDILPEVGPSGPFVGEVSGTITTDGKIGALISTDIAGYSLTLSNSRLPHSLSITLTPANSGLLLNPGSLSATATNLLFDFDSTKPTIFIIDSVLSPSAICFEGFTGSCSTPPDSETLSFGNEFQRTFTGVRSIASASATPLPAALPLFATGLGALGLFGWRRKRKETAVAV